MCIRDRHGADQVFKWRRGFDVFPPMLEKDDKRHPANELRYKGFEPPSGESLKATQERVLPYWSKNILPELKAGKNILIAAHGNSLRALLKHIENISDEDIPGINIPTGKPIVFDYNIESSEFAKR